jgi:2-amino-4-hydroxy-6-hydroxymethyldihydropteridine diphosphokinase
MNLVYLSLGTNMGDRKLNIELAYAMITQSTGTIRQKSSLYETPPWGFESTSNFINTVVLLETYLDLEELFKKLKQIEKEIGRTKTANSTTYEDRIIDIDILDFNGKISHSDELTVPHPRIEMRNFVLIPLAEIAPNWIHPLLKRPVNKLILNLNDQSKVERLN